MDENGAKKTVTQGKGDAGFFLVSDVDCGVLGHLHEPSLEMIMRQGLAKSNITRSRIFRTDSSILSYS